MAVGADNPVVADYLRRLDAEAAALPAGRRAELVAEIRAHVAEALAAAGRDDEPTVRGVLDRLGEPADIVAAETDGTPGSAAPAAGSAPFGSGYGSGAASSGAAMSGSVPPAYVPAGASGVPAPYGTPPRSPWGTVEILAIVGLTAGTVLIPVVGLLLGLVFLWASQQWTRREKWIGTALTLAPLLVAVLAALALFAARAETSSGTPQVVQAPQVVESLVPAVSLAPTPAP